MQHLIERSQQLQKSFVEDTAQDLRQRYKTLQANIHRLRERLGSEVTAHEQYKGVYHECLEWVTLTRHQLQQLSDTTGSQEQVKVKLDAFKVRVDIWSHPWLNLRGEGTEQRGNRAKGKGMPCSCCLQVQWLGYMSVSFIKVLQASKYSAMF